MSPYESVPMLAQINNDLPAEAYPPEYELEPSPLHWLFGGTYALFSLAYTALTIWMAIECLRKDSERFLWIWIIIFVPGGNLFYFFFCWLPSSSLQSSSPARRYRRGKEIDRLKIAAEQIGNAHQYIQLGDALRETGRYEPAGKAYAAALEKESEDRQALWGAGLVDFELKRFESAHDHLKKLLEIDSQYKFGDVSLVYGKTLSALGDTAAAEEHLEQHVHRWRHPEALWTLARIAADRGDVSTARSHLQALLLDINGSPRAIARRHGVWKRKARRLMKKMPPPKI